MADNQSSSKKINRMSQGDMPRASLADSVKLAESLRDDFAGKDATPIDLAQSMSRSPSSSTWRFLTGAAVAYGLTTGGYNSSTISLTELGRKVAIPTLEGEDKIAILTAALNPAIPKAFYEKYNKNKFPSETIAKNVLHQLGVPLERTEEALKIVKSNAKFTGMLTVVGGSEYIQIRTSGPEPLPTGEGNLEDGGEAEQAESEPSENSFKERENSPKPIFVAHGKDKKALAQLKAILDQFKIPYKVAVDEPHSGRPISEKVRDLMNECGSAIILFSTNGESVDSETGTVANLNVVFELGAASVLYGDKIIIFKEQGLSLPSDFSDLGYIGFERDKLDAQALDLLKELISMGFVQVTPAV